jgi:MoaA/NifB/PqqE/SkfB family radical SAM enzyme
MPKINLKENRAFCILPFIHLHVNENNDVKPCCLSGLNGITKYTKDFNFNNNLQLEEIRQKMLAGERVSACTECYQLDDAGTYSSRTQETAEWVSKLNIETFEDVKTNLVYYDIRNDNLCNLSCRMCSPQFSSQLEKEYKRLNWPVPVQPKSFSFTNTVDIDTVQKIYVAGGEPSLMLGFREFLQRAIASKRTDIEIRMNTNATNLNKEYRQLLGHFSNVHIVVSLDGYDKINKYIRWPADWPSLIENVHGLYKITNYISFNVTVGIWNISNLSQLVFFLEREFPNTNVLMNKIYRPKSQEFTTFPNKELALQDLELLKLSKFYQQFLFQSKVDYYIAGMKNSRVDIDALIEFFEFNDRLDQSRDVKLIDYIPELEACRSYITKQIYNTNAEL